LLFGLLLAGCSRRKNSNIFHSSGEATARSSEAHTATIGEDTLDYHTSANAQEVFKKLEAEGIDPVLYGLTDKDYELIAKNFANIRNKLKEIQRYPGQIQEVLRSRSTAQRDERIHT
jgi:hypothetical protein